jgi:DNA-binding CsgD family transcriptional regulator/tetratricopeptide (TPR) repeat protein
LSEGQPFVGRESELRQLQGAFEAAASGNGRLVLLVGEPGIGKTALCDQLARFVSASDGLLLVGHCYEEGSFRLPYQPFVEVFATYLQECDIEALSTGLGSGVAELLRMVPSLRERRNIAPRPPGDPEEDRWRLLQAATDLLRSAAAKQPLLVVLEDLHDADRGTLDLLLYLARNLHGCRLLLVGSYRDVAVDRAHPLSAALTGLHRASNVSRIQLHGLSTGEVRELLAEASQQTVPQPFAELVQRHTEGNPLFVRETLRFVIDAGLVERRGGTLRPVGDQSLAGRIPEGLRDAVGKRLSRLTSSANRILSVASVIGREFQLDVLRQVIDSAEEELEVALEEASAAAILEEHSAVGATITYRFSHAFFRQTLYDEIVAPRRIRLHQQVAHALEEVYSRRLDEHADELAEHFSFYSDAPNLVKAVEYGEVAARQATEVFSYGEAARQLDRALLVQDLVDPNDPAKRCDLLLSLGEALWPAGETQRVIAQVAPDALSLAQALDDPGRASRACRLALDAFMLQGATAPAALPEFRAWAERARAYAEAHSIERIKADHALALVRITQGRWQEARALRIEALARARQLSDADVLFRSAFWVMDNSGPQDLVEGLRLVEESNGWSRRGVSGRTLGSFLWTSGILQLAIGERARAEEVWRQMEEIAERTHDATVRLLIPQRSATLAMVDGQLEKSLELVGQLIARADELGASVRGRFFGLGTRVSPALYLGRAEIWLSALEDYNSLAGLSWVQSAPIIVAVRATCLAQLVRVEEGRALITPVLDEVEAGGGEKELPIRDLTPLLSAAVLFEHRGAARVLSDQLACVAHLAISDWLFPTCVARELGDAAVLLGERAAARTYYERALEAAGKIRFRPELALTRVGLAELLLRDADDAARSEASEHLDIAIPELRDMKMQPGLERALALRENVAPNVAMVVVRDSVSDMLTAREREIAGLVADGLSNHDIAQRLVISEGTVEVHVKHILSKLGFRSRTQVAGWVLRQDAGS